MPPSEQGSWVNIPSSGEHEDTEGADPVGRNYLKYVPKSQLPEGSVSKILDVGCGKNKFPNAIGIDQFAGEGVDVVHDLRKFPWPFADALFDRVVCRHSIQHIPEFVEAVQEIHRILKPGGVLEVWGPHFSSDNFFTDPTMVISLGFRSFDYFAPNPFAHSFCTTPLFEIESTHISFRNHGIEGVIDEKFNPFKALGMEMAINGFPRIYERFFAFWLPAGEVYFRMRKLS